MIWGKVEPRKPRSLQYDALAFFLSRANHRQPTNTYIHTIALSKSAACPPSHNIFLHVSDKDWCCSLASATPTRDHFDDSSLPLVPAYRSPHPLPRNLYLKGPTERLHSLSNSYAAPKFTSNPTAMSSQGPTTRTATSNPQGGSRTMEVRPQPVLRLSAPSGVLRLRAEPAERRRIQWAEDVVDNEGMGKKSSKGTKDRLTS